MHPADAEVLTIYGDRIAIREAITCLIDNAIEYSPSLTDIEVVVEQRGSTACVVILDRGPGFVGERDHSSDFDSTKTATSHIGLGLAIVEKVATSHGGQFTITEREGGGSRCDLCFTVC